MNILRNLPACLAILLVALMTTCRADAAEPQAAIHIPFLKGLTVVYAVSEPQGDYESLHTIASIGRDGYRLQVSAQLPGHEQPDTALRAVDIRDQNDSHRIRDGFIAGDPELFPDTVPGFSRILTIELQSESAHLVYLVVESGFVKSSFVRRSLSGTLHLVGHGPEQMPMLVNGHEVLLPVLHGKGKLGDAEGTVAAEYYVLADDDNPIVLKSHVGDTRLQAVRIEYPLADGASDSIEQQLVRGETVQVHSIYFAFGSAAIRPESQRVLKEIAAILGKHPDWRLQIDGHTDAIGANAANLKLSQSRAAAVKAALVGEYHIDGARLTTAGHGESQPKDTNDTAEGRSRNRRVELRRL